MAVNNLLAQRYDDNHNSNRKMIEELAELTRSSKFSVRNWIVGLAKPTPIKIKIIAEYLGVTEEELAKSFNEQ